MINPPLHSWGFPLCGKRRKGWDAGRGGEAVNCCPRLSAVGSSLVKMGENGNALVLPVKFLVLSQAVLKGCWLHGAGWF